MILPTEILVLIGDFASNPTLNAMARANRHFHSIFDDILWRREIDSKPRGGWPFGVKVSIDAGNQEAVLKFLRLGICPNDGKRGNETLLGRALENRNDGMAKILLEHGADINVGPAYFSPLNTALRNRCGPEIVTMLLEREPLLEFAMVGLRCATLDTLCHVGRYVLRALAAQGLELDDARFQHNRLLALKLLTVSCAVGTPREGDRALRLVRQLSRDNVPISQLCSGPLFYAIRGKNMAMIRWLILEQGVDLDQVALGNLRPLYFALQRGELEIADCLLGSSASGWVSENIPPVFGAVASGDLDVLQYAIDHGGDISATAPDGETALHHAIVPYVPPTDYFHPTVIGEGNFNQSLPMVQKLVELGVPVNRGSIPRASVLHDAIRAGWVEVVRFLLEKGALVNDTIPEAAHDTPLARAVLQDRTDCIDLLLQYGANPDSNQSHHLYAPLALVRSGAAAELLLKYGGRLTMDGRPIRAIVDRAISGGNQDILAVFRKYIEIPYVALGSA
jgi:ankyrin repeat protein